jgi:polyisoprenoid-binding protein YceI
MKKTTLLAAVMLTLTGFISKAQPMSIDVKKSNIKWIGKKIGGQHEGTIQFRSGELEWEGNQIKDGSFVVDMHSIACTDLTNETYNGKLVGHLKSDDFFGVEKHPLATLTVSNSGPFIDGAAKVNGQMTIKGKMQFISFDLKKNRSGYTARLELDRSLYDVRYGSKSFFDSLGDKAIDDIFILEVQLVMN